MCSCMVTVISVLDIFYSGLFCLDFLKSINGLVLFLRVKTYHIFSCEGKSNSSNSMSYRVDVILILSNSPIP